jgi:disulfide bond formation protein DsbB
MVGIVNQALGILSVVAQVFSIALIVDVIIRRGKPDDGFVAFFRKNAILISFIVALVSMLGSLFYSDVAGYEPCTYCWYQRILMYPQVVLLLVALIKKRNDVALYSLPLSIIGGLIALYHYLGQLSITSLPCQAIGYSASCSQRFVMQFGYITIPMMALSAFILMIVLMVLSKRSSRA